MGVRWVTRVLLIVTLASVVWAMVGELVLRPSGAPGFEGGEPVRVLGWERAKALGVQFGDAEAPVQVVVFTDLACAACRFYYKLVLEDVVVSSPGRNGVVLVEMPVGDEVGRRVSLGAKCAGEQGRYRRFVEMAFASSEEGLGGEGLAALAADAGVRDVEAWSECVAAPSEAILAAIEEGRSFAMRLGIRTLPTVMMNGWVFPFPPDGEQLELAMGRLARGVEPS